MTAGTATGARGLRDVLGRFATGVTVITTTAVQDAGTRPVGMTVNSFASVSLDPPLILFCVSRVSRLHSIFASARTFAVNILGESQTRLSGQFARPGFDRFGQARTVRGRSGAPLLDGALATIECAVEKVIGAGDHDIVLGRVLVAEESGAGTPLIFYGGAYRRLEVVEADWWSALT
ncbi:flavin reductase family protein [Microbispora sp. RL4-1S]|uniref:Flavin reductase family protein n=1 Tax=Microbispora oryzae TaxID=2806554 RepID=A0A940WMB1_9ACTN|nr:flavin reductase family protein [Microbispora oryzae]MBP2708260.1 flavin reductase family protein [Microbispora oryzae]